MKKFEEVFPSLKTEGTMHELLKLVEVERVTTTPDMSFVRIYLVSPRLIEKQDIYKLENAIKTGLFPKKQLIIKIIEKFRLSEQYTPENLFNTYKDSILGEFKSYSIIEYRILKTAEVKFLTRDVMEISVENTRININHINDLIKRLEENIFLFRCGMAVKVKSRLVAYIQPLSRDEYYEVVKRSEISNKQERYIEQSSQQSELPNDDSGQNAPWDDKPQSKPQNKLVSITQDKKSKKVTEKKTDKDNKANYYVRKASNNDLLFGRDFPDDIIPMKDIQGEMGEATVQGQIITLDSRFLERSGSTLFIFAMTDFSDSIMIKMFVNEENLEEVKNIVKLGSFIKLRGITTIDRFDGELTIGSVKGIRKCDNFQLHKRMDNAIEKRVELHCHTKMSDVDAVSSASDIIKKVAEWGMPAIAITDHGNVQSFPEAYHTVCDMKDMIPPKIIYGVEGYLVDDLKDIVTNAGEYKLDDKYVVFDLETTGFSPVSNRIIEIGAVKIVGGVITDSFSGFVNPEIPIPFRIEELTGISDLMVLDAPVIKDILPKFIEFCGDCAVVAHNAAFDTGFIRENALKIGLEYNPTIVDTVSLARLLMPQLNRFKLDTVAKALGVSLKNHHRAVDDAACTAEIFLKFIKMLNERDITTLREVSKLAETNADLVKKMNTNHVIILVKNEIGRVNLYRLISYSHIDYFNKRPRIPKSVLVKYREGLIIGSACEAGEVYSALLSGQSSSEIRRLVNFYDYLEIQPVGNNLFMIASDKFAVESEEDIRELNRKVVKLGEQYNKPVVATCDVHFLNPEDEVYRRIIEAGQGYHDADNQPPLFLRTTEEMIKEFEYLGPDKAEEVVIKNTRKISDMIDNISPVRPDKCPPVIENSDNDLKESCYIKAYQQYGIDRKPDEIRAEDEYCPEQYKNKKLPDIVIKRLHRELHSIITNGFAVMYIIAKKLVEKSNEDGYLVGSRGSVGSSFAAYTANITEVNPLPAHYFCEACQYSDFDSATVKEFAGRSGCDMPDKICPVCGTILKKDGHDIPFETFLGFNGDKEPDIDLNFSGEYQSKAHEYTEQIFGKGHTFRAGTVGTLAEKTAFGYVKKYYEEHDERKRKCEIDRIAKGCVGVRRTTGQHPGGIVVLPHGEEIYSFTPVQRPANDMTTKTITTHFEYHAIDHNLLKLDILGHQDPTMIRMLQDLIKIDPVKDIPLDDKKVMSLFQNTSALGIESADILGCPLGALGVPEFGTDFAMQMLIDAKPTGFSDLIRIAGLAHGTDVWLGNAQTLIQEGKATIRTAICTRDDIMIYLMEKGVDPGHAFKIMEGVRKGKGLKPEQEAEMIENDVPDWYIWSCKKIKYMFPKAHAAAYVMMAWRIAYCKIYYPLEYYASYYSIRATAFSYELMCMGKEKLEYHIADYKKRSDTFTAKDEDTLRDMKIVQEMYARGYQFATIDLFKAQAMKFTIIDGKIMPSFSSIDGLGENVAKQIVETAKTGPFISKDDFKNRTKASGTVCDLMGKLGILGNLPESNQYSIFDMI